MDAVSHWRKVHRVAPWLIETASRCPERRTLPVAPPRGRRHPGDGLFIQSGACRLGLPSRWRSTRFIGRHRSLQGLPLRRASPRDDRQHDACSTSPKVTARLRLPPLLPCVRACPRTSTRWARSCACAASRSLTRDRGPRQRRASRGRLRDPHPRQGPTPRGRAPAPAPPAATPGSATFTREPPGSCSSRCPWSCGVCGAELRLQTAIFGHRLPQTDLRAVRAIYDTVKSRPERYELNLHVSAPEDEQ